MICVEGIECPYLLEFLDRLCCTVLYQVDELQTYVIFNWLNVMYSALILVLRPATIHQTRPASKAFDQFPFYHITSV